MLSKRKKMRQEKRQKRGGEKEKSQSQDCCVTFKPKNVISKFCFLRMPELRKLIFSLYFASGSERRKVYDR